MTQYAKLSHEELVARVMTRVDDWRMKNQAVQIANCGLKKAFQGRGHALIFAIHRRLKQKPYRCVICGHWHLTSKGAKA